MLRHSRELFGVLLALVALFVACGGREDLQRTTPLLAPGGGGNAGAAGAAGVGMDALDGALASGAGGTTPDADFPSNVAAPAAGCEAHIGPTCDPGRDCGCASGQTCNFVLQGDRPVPVCRAVSTAAAAPYSACVNDTECAAAYSCVEGICRKTCEAESDCGWPGAACVAVHDGFGNELGGWKVCSRYCDPVSPEQPAEGFQACGPGMQCYPFDEERTLDCALPVSSAGEGALCFQFTECAPGMYCSVEGRCTRWCALGGDDCGPGNSCDAFVPRLSVGGRELGTCVCEPVDGAICDPLSDCGCSAGQSCRLEESLRPSCRNIASGGVSPYAQCSFDEYCPPQHSCVDGVCKQHCGSADDCGWPGATCEPLIRGNSTRDGWNVCTRHCDPLLPQSPRPGFLPCGAGTNCLPIGDPVRTDCYGPAGFGGEGVSCVREADCLPGFACGTDGVCRKWCDVASPYCQAPGADCVPTSPPTSVGGEQFGFCACPGLVGACDLVTGCGCAAGFSCGFGGLGLAECRYAFGFGDWPYSACTDSYYCAPLHSCVNGVCAKQCNTATDCGWPSARCAPVLDLAGEPIPGFGTCTRNCDLESPYSPSVGFQDCYGGQCVLLTANDGSPLETDCRRAGFGVTGEPCSSASDCQSGFFCDDGSCRRWCRLEFGFCDEGLSCTALDPPVLVGGVEFGACTAQ